MSYFGSIIFLNSDWNTDYTLGTVVNQNENAESLVAVTERFKHAQFCDIDF